MKDAWVCVLCTEKLWPEDVGRHLQWHLQNDQHPPPSVALRHVRLPDPADEAENDLEGNRYVDGY